MSFVSSPIHAGAQAQDPLFELSPLMASLAAACLNPRMAAIYFSGACEVAHVFVERIAAARNSATRILDWPALASPALTTCFLSLLGTHDMVLFFEHDLSNPALCARWRGMAFEQAEGAPAAGAGQPAAAPGVPPFTSVFCGGPEVPAASLVSDALSLVIDISWVRDIEHAHAIAGSVHLARLLGETTRPRAVLAQQVALPVNTHLEIRAITARVTQLSATMGAEVAGATHAEFDACRERLLKLIAHNANRGHAGSPPSAPPELPGLIKYWRET